MEPISRPSANELDSSDHGRPSSDIGGHGLGIDVPSTSSSPARQSRQIPRTPVGGRRQTASQDEITPALASPPLLSPPSTGGLSGKTAYNSDITLNEFGSPNLDTAYHSKQSLLPAHPSRTSHLHKTSTASVREQYDDDFALNHMCNSSTHFKRGMNNWLAIAIVLLSLFSTVFSGIFVAIALRAPRYGRMVGTDGSLTISNAAFLTSFFGKMIELSFVTVVVAFIGQCLARRAYGKTGHQGVTLADMSMRNWISQPGTMVTHWESVRYAGFSWLGVLAVVATIMAMLYTSAGTAVVQPQLKFSHWEKRTLQGLVATSFANTRYLQQQCKTPITTASMLEDTEQDRQNTCISIEHASQSYHNYQHWLTHWTTTAAAGNATAALAQRPPGWALLNDNTTITGPWIEQKNLTQDSHGWLINNVTMAFPHPGVVQAAQDPSNGIMQPNELNGLGIYSIQASVPSPFINVLCVTGIQESSLRPLVSEMWPSKTNKSDTLNTTDLYLGGTDFDGIFGWGPDAFPTNWPPVFPQLPADYNTVANDTTNIAYGRTAVYVLGKGGAPTANSYALCQLQVGQTPNCTTQYNASSNVATLEAICEDRHDEMRFIKSEKKALSPAWSPDWPNVASMWMSSVNLNSGAIEANSSNSRLWTELIFANTPPVNWETGQPILNLDLPSPAEALAVMSGCTLLQSAQDAPFTEFFNYSGYGILDPPQTQVFNASVHQQQYASGGTEGYERAFHLVLFIVFLINVFILLYWLWHRAWYVDFSDPTNLFALAINSPPSKQLAECSCGHDTKDGKRFKQFWKLDNDVTNGHVYMASPDPREGGEGSEVSPRSSWRLKRPRLSETFQMVTSPVAKAKGRWTRVST